MINRASVPVLMVIGLLSANLWAASADEEELLLSYGDESFVSIATGRKQAIAKAPAAASVITAEDIRAIGARDLSEALELVPGVHISSRAAGYNSIITIRGIYSEFNPQVLMLINGIPVTNLIFGNRGEAWGGMAVESISRIEVIRGPGSAVYGADAFAGTINIVTKDAREIDGLEVGASAGSFEEHRAWMLYGGQLAGWDAAFSLEVLDTDGFDEKVSADAQTGLDVLMGTSASLAPGRVSLGRENADIRFEMSKENWKARLGYQGRKDGGVGAGAGQALDPVGKGESKRLNADITYHNLELVKDWDVEAKLSYFDISTETDLVLFPPGAFMTSPFGGFPDGVLARPDVYERHYRFDTSAFYSAIEDHDIRVGVGYHYLDQYRIEETKNFIIVATPGGPLPVPLGGLVNVTDTAPFNREEVREVSYLFVQDEWKLMRDWALTTGLRYDHYSDFGDTVNPRIALVWDTSYRLTSKLMYGRAFRAPSFAEQFNINNPIAVGNENLDPETIDTYELAFDYAHSPELRLGLNLFYYEMEDIIVFSPVAENAGGHSARGLEFEFKWDWTQALTLMGNYAYQKAQEKGSSHDSYNAPQHQLYLRADYALVPNWSVSTQVNRVMDRRRAFDDPRSKVDDYTGVDLTLRGKNLLPGVEVAFSVRNLIDDDIYEPSASPGVIPNDLPMAGRSVFAEIRKSW